MREKLRVSQLDEYLVQEEGLSCYIRMVGIVGRP